MNKLDFITQDQCKKTLKKFVIYFQRLLLRCEMRMGI